MGLRIFTDALPRGPVVGIGTGIGVAISVGMFAGGVGPIGDKLVVAGFVGVGSVGEGSACEVLSVGTTDRVGVSASGVGLIRDGFVGDGIVGDGIVGVRVIGNELLGEGSDCEGFGVAIADRVGVSTDGVGFTGGGLIEKVSVGEGGTVLGNSEEDGIPIEEFPKVIVGKEMLLLLGTEGNDGEAIVGVVVLKTGTTVTTELKIPPGVDVAPEQSVRVAATPQRHSSTTEHPHSSEVVVLEQIGARGEESQPEANGSAGQGQGS
jgi:hypothetical protein